MNPQCASQRGVYAASALALFESLKDREVLAMATVKRRECRAP
jgi:hypothetical protein